MTAAARHVVLTRSEAGSAPWAAALRDALGLRVSVWPCIEQRLKEATRAELIALKGAMAAPGGGFVVCTSVFGALGIRAWLDAAGLGPAHGLGAAAVGPVTAEAMERALGVVPSVARPHAARGLLALLEQQLKAPTQIIVPQSTLAHPALTRGLCALGHTVLALAVYETVPYATPPVAAETKLPWSDDGRQTCIVVASPSAVTGLVARLAKRAVPPVLALGPTTYQAAKSQLPTAVAMAPEASLSGVLAWFRQQRAC